MQNCGYNGNIIGFLTNQLVCLTMSLGGEIRGEILGIIRDKWGQCCNMGRSCSDGETNHRGDKMWTSKKKQMVLRHLVSCYASDLLEDPMKNGDETPTHSFMFGYSIWKHIGY